MNGFERHQGIGMTSQRTRNRLVNRLQEKGIHDMSVLEVISKTPRHIFVDEALATRAYEDTALPIGFGQTISQPYIVARMTELLIKNTRPHKVLEVGTGCGYQSVVLAQLVDELYTVELLEPLHNLARQRFRELGMHNIHARLGDGWQGWEDHAPYDGILVAAAPPEVPEALKHQLAEGGRLVIPVGEAFETQQLLLITREGDEFLEEQLDLVAFVPLVKGKQ